MHCEDGKTGPGDCAQISAPLRQAWRRHRCTAAHPGKYMRMQHLEVAGSLGATATRTLHHRAAVRRRHRVVGVSAIPQEHPHLPPDANLSPSHTNP